MKVIILYGSANDQAFMQPGRDYLEEQKIPYEEKVLSVHRNTDELLAYLAELKHSDEEFHRVEIDIVLENGARDTIKHSQKLYWEE